MRRTFRWLLSMVGLASMLVPVTPSAAIVAERTPMNVGGLVVSSTSVKELKGEGTIIRTYAMLRVTSADREALVGTVIPVVADGGRIGDERTWVEMMPALSKDAEVSLVVIDGSLPYEVSTGSPPEPFQAPGYLTVGEMIESEYNLIYGYGWACPRYLPGSYYHNLTGAPSGARAAVNAGYEAWENDASSWMEFNDAGTTSIRSQSNDGTNAVFWLTDNAGTYLARTWVYANGSRITGFDVQFNTRYSYSTNPNTSQVDIQSVATHEAGHDVGLDHVSNCTQIMGTQWIGGVEYGCLDYGEKHRTLGSDDLAGLRFLTPYNDIRGTFQAQSPSNSTLIMIPGQRYPTDLNPAKFTARFRNTGKTPWGNWSAGSNEIRLNTALPANRTSPFCDSTWISCARPDRATTLVCTGEEITMDWYMKAPLAVGTYDEAFGFVVGSTTVVSSSPRWSEIIAQG